MNVVPAAVLSVLVQARGIKQTNTGLTSVHGGLERTGKAGTAMGSRIARGAKVAATGLAVVLGLGFGAAISKGVEFEKRMDSLGAVMEATSKQSRQLQQQALRQGEATVFSANQVADAQIELAKGGLKAEQILGGALPAALSLAAAGELELGAAAETTVNAMKLFGLEGREAGSVADMLATAANRTTADVLDFAMALKQGGSVTKLAGYDMNETVAVLEALAEAGIKNSDAGTSMKAAVIQLLKPSEKQAKLQKELNVEFVARNGHLKSGVGISKELRRATEDMTKAERAKTLATLAGTDGVRTLNALYMEGPKALAALERANAAQGTAQEVAARKMDNLAGDVDQLGGAFETLEINLMGGASPALRQITQDATRLVQQINAIATNPALGEEEKITKVFDLVAGAASQAFTEMVQQAAHFGPRFVTAFVSGVVNTWNDMSPLAKLFSVGVLVRALGGKGAIIGAGAAVGRMLGGGVTAGVTQELAVSGVVAGAEGASGAAVVAGAGAAAGGPKLVGPFLGPGSAAPRRAAADATARAFLADAFGGATLATMGSGLQREAAKSGAMKRAGASIGGGLGTAAGAAASSGLVQSIGSKLKAVRWGRVGALGIGLVLADNMLSEFQRRADEKSGDLLTELGAKLKGKELGISGTPLHINIPTTGDGGIFDPHGFFSETSEEKSIKNLKAEYEEMARARVKLSSATITGLRAQAEGLDLTKEARAQLEQMFRVAEQGRNLGVKVDLGMDPEKLRSVTAGLSTLRSGVLTSMHDIARVTRQNMGVIASQMGSKSKEGREALADNYRAAVMAIGKAMTNGDISIKQGLRRQKQLLHNANLLTGDDPLGIAKGFAASWGKAGGISDRQRQGMIADLAKMPPALRAKAFDAMVGYGQGLVQGGKIPKGDLRDFRSAVLAQFDDLRQGGTQSSLDLAIGIAGNFGSMGQAVANVLSIIRDNTNNSLTKLGAKPLDFAIKAVGNFLGLGGQNGQKKETGGFIVPGVGSGDRPFPGGLEVGSFVMNREATAAARLAAGGRVPVELEPGEAVFGPREVKAIGAGRLEAMNRAVRRKDGGPIGTPQIAGPAGPLLDIGRGATDVVAKAAKAYVEKQKPAGSALAGMGNAPGDLKAAMALAQSMGLTITSTTGGQHAPNSWHYKGRAFDASNGVGTPQERGYAIAAANRWGSRILELFYDPLGWYIKNGRKVPGAIGGHSDHVHTAMKLGGLVQALARGGRAGTEGPLWEAQFRHKMEEAWKRAAPLLGRGSSSEPPSIWFPKGLTRTTGNVGEVSAGPQGERTVAFDKGWGRQFLRGGDYAQASLLHEWAHVFQRLGLAKWEREGGATAFQRYASPIVFGDAPGRYPAGYRKFAERVAREKGSDWIRHGQFGHQLGGLVQALIQGGSVSAWDDLVGSTWNNDELATLAHIVHMSNPGLMAQKAQGESSGNRKAVGHDAGGTEGLGLWQITTGYNDELIAKYGGRESMFHPYLNAEAAKEILDQQGVGAWYAPATGPRGTVNQHLAKQMRAIAGGGTPDDHSYKEDVPAEWKGLRTKSLHFPTTPKNLKGVARELHRWEDELDRYRHGVDVAKKDDRPAIAQALEHNVTSIRNQLRELRHERKTLKVDVARKSFSGRLGRQLSRVTGLETAIDQARQAYERRTQLAEQIVALEPLQGPIAANLDDQARQAAEEAYVRRLTAYVEGQERPAYQAVLGAAGNWRNVIIGAEHTATNREVGWEGQLRAKRVEIAAINAYTEEVGRHLKHWRQSKKKGAKMPDALRRQVETRDTLRDRLPMLRFQAGELGKVLEEARGAFFPGSRWITPGKNFRAHGQKAVPGTGAPINPPRPPLPGTGTFEDALREVQGSHWPDQHEFLGSIGAERVPGRFGGAIWEAQTAIQELGLRVSEAAASIQQVEGVDDSTGDDSRLTDTLRELLRQANVKNAVAEAQGAAMAGWNQMRQGLNASDSAFAGMFAGGGVIPPGMWGIAGETGRPEIVAGGMHGARVLSPEESAPALGGAGHRAGELEVTVNIKGDVIPAPGVDPDDVIEVLVSDPRVGAAITQKVLSSRGTGRPTPGDRSWR